MAEYGIPTGLAVDLQFDQRINDLRYHQAQDQRAKAMAEARAKMFADDLEYQNAINSFDAPIIKDYSRNVMRQIGQFVRDNPDWSTNVDKRIQLKAYTRQLKDNPDLHRGLASDAAYKQLLSDYAEAQKNPQFHDMDAYKERFKEWDNYTKHGNQLGEEGLKNEGRKSFIYNKPRDFVDLDKVYQDAGSKFADMRTRPIKGGRNAYEEYANPESLRNVAANIYAQNKRQIDLEAAKRGIDPLTLVAEGVDSYIKKKRDFGDYGLSDAIVLANYKKRQDGLDRDVVGSAYQQAFVNANEGMVNPNFLEQTYGSKPNHIIYNNKGEQSFDNTGNRVYYTGAHKWLQGQNGKKQKVVEIYTYLTPEQAEEKGIFDAGKWNPFQGEEIVPEWNKQAELITTDNGKGDPVKMVKVKSFMPVELNSAYAGAFDNEVHIAKSKLMGQQPNEGGSGAQLGAIVTDNNTGKKYKVVQGGYEPIN